MHVKRSFFTLIEILIVFTILSVVVGVVGFKIKEAADEQRFLSQAHELVSTLALAQDLMLIQDADVLFKMAYNLATKQYECWIEVEKPLEGSWAKLVQRKVPLPDIGNFSFNESQREKLELLFSLQKMSQGELILERKTSKNSLGESNFKISLPGYPRPFASRGKVLQEDAINKEALYPKEVYDEIYKDKVLAPV